MTRDSNSWYWIIAASVLTALASKLDVIDPLFPVSMHAQMHAVIELGAMIVGIIAAGARMSPLPISPEGRVEAAQKRSERLDVASVIALDSAQKADKAVTATKEAADAATLASEVSEKAAGG